MNLTGLLTGIGQAGSDVAQAKLDAQQANLKALFDKLGLKQGEVNLAESQERLKKMQGNPDLEKANQTLAAFKSVFGRDPSEQEKSFLFGMPQAPAVKPPTNKLEAWRAAYMKEHGGQEPTAAEIEGFDKKEPTDKAVKVSMTGDIATQVTDADGKTWRAHDPALPPELAAIVKDHEQAAETTEKRKASLEAEKTAAALRKAIALGDIHAQQKEYTDIWKVAQRGINGHGFLKTVAQEVAASEAGGGRGTKFGDMNIAEGFMQLMFGLNPKALRGSPQMLEAILKQSGGWDDRAIANINGAITGGRLSQDVRNQIQEAATRQVEAWDQQVRQTAALTDDPKVKALMEKYDKQVLGDVDQEIKDLGGKAH
jgi:hypothetical protein